MSNLLSSKFFSNIARSLGGSLFAFPREVVCMLVAAIAFMIQMEHTGHVERIALHTGLIAILVMNISLAVTIVVRSGRIKTLLGWIAWAALSAPIGWYVYGLDFAIEVSIVQYCYLVVLVHFLVIASWITYGSVERYWNAVVKLFHRFLFSLAFSSLLISGLSTAIVAVRVLFGMEQFVNLEFHVTIGVYFLFNTLLFLSGIPSSEELNKAPEVPRVTIGLTRFVLVPIIAVFLVILYAYGVKVVVEGATEVVAYYVLLLSGTTIIATLLTWPKRNDQGLIWKLLHRHAPFALLPLIALALYSWFFHVSGHQIDAETFTTSLLLATATMTIGSWIFHRNLDPRVPALLILGTVCLTSVGPISVGTISSHSAVDQNGYQNGRKADNIEYYRYLSPTHTINAYIYSDHWSSTFSILDAQPNDDGSPVIVNSDDSLTTISFVNQSTMVTIISKAAHDTITFDAALLVTDSTDVLIPVVVERKESRTVILCSSIKLKKQNGRVFVYGLVGASFTSRLPINK